MHFHDQLSYAENGLALCFATNYILSHRRGYASSRHENGIFSPSVLDTMDSFISSFQKKIFTCKQYLENYSLHLDLISFLYKDKLIKYLHASIANLLNVCSNPQEQRFFCSQLYCLVGALPPESDLLRLQVGGSSA